MCANTVVLGLGNTLLSDEGVGVHAINYLKAHAAAPEGVTLLDGGTLSFTLALPLHDADRLIVIDAAELNAAPGSVQVFEDEAMDEHLKRGGRRSVHEVGLTDLLAIARLSGRLPQRRALIGVQPQKLDWGDGPTAAVAGAVPEACRLAAELVERWR